MNLSEAVPVPGACGELGRTAPADEPLLLAGIQGLENSQKPSE